METFPAKDHQLSHRQNLPLQHLAATREEVILLSHLLHAAWEVERDSPARRAIVAHWNLVRIVFVMLIIVLSVAIGLLAPQILHTLGA